MSRTVVTLVLLLAGCGLTPEKLGPRPDAELCFGRTSSNCNYSYEPVDERWTCPDASGTAQLDYVLVNAGELPLDYELVPDDTNPGFVTLGPSAGRIRPLGEQPFSVVCDAACMQRFRTSPFHHTSWDVVSNDPRRPRFNFVVHLGSCPSL